jgi:hypothetical protein
VPMSRWTGRARPGARRSREGWARTVKSSAPVREAGQVPDHLIGIRQMPTPRLLPYRGSRDVLGESVTVPSGDEYVRSPIANLDRHGQLTHVEAPEHSQRQVVVDPAADPIAALLEGGLANALLAPGICK